MTEIAIVRVGLDRLEQLVEFWKLLHRHQASVAVVVPGLDVLSESASAEIVREMYRQWLTSADPFAFIAEDAGRPVGFVVGFYDEPHFMWATGRVGHIDSFYVLPEMRGRGVGRLLMDAAYSEMRRAGASTVALEMVAGNEVARAFYERDGFTTTFVQMHRQLDVEASSRRRSARLLGGDDGAVAVIELGMCRAGAGGTPATLPRAPRPPSAAVRRA